MQIEAVGISSRCVQSSKLARCRVLLHLVKAALLHKRSVEDKGHAESHNAAVHSLLMATPPAPTLQFANLFARQIHAALSLNLQRMRPVEKIACEIHFLAFVGGLKVKKLRKQFAILFQLTNKGKNTFLPEADFCERGHFQYSYKISAANYSCMK